MFVGFGVGVLLVGIVVWMCFVDCGGLYDDYFCVLNCEFKVNGLMCLVLFIDFDCLDYNIDVVMCLVCCGGKYLWLVEKLLFLFGLLVYIVRCVGIWWLMFFY